MRGRAVDWEPQYNLLPVTFSDIQTIRHTRPGDAPKDQPKAKAQEAPPPVAKPKANDAKKPAGERTKPKGS